MQDWAYNGYSGMVGGLALAEDRQQGSDAGKIL